MENLLKVIYTPLDCPPIPEFSIDEIRQWIKETHNNEQQSFIKSYYNKKTAEQYYKESYPWDLTFVKWEMWDHELGWLNQFNIKFPSLSKYFYEAFGILDEEIGQISLLPTRENFTGIGFWHNDMDNFGLRMYLEFDHLNENKLLFKKTKFPHTEWKHFGYSKDYNYISNELQDDVIDCKIMNSTQCFYINNVRSVHTTYTVKKGNRIAVFISPKPSFKKDVWKKTEELVYNSALKFQDYSVFY